MSQPYDEDQSFDAQSEFIVKTESSGYKGGNEFTGQQEDERILHIIRPHKLMLITSLGKGLILALIVGAAWWRGGNHLNYSYPGILLKGYLLIIACLVPYILWIFRYYNSYRAYITDRRVIRFEAAFPITENRRVLFWRNTGKTKSMAKSALWRAFKIGSIEICPTTAEGGVDLHWVSKFEQITDYIDRIVYVARECPAKLPGLQPLILDKVFEFDGVEELDLVDDSNENIGKISDENDIAKSKKYLDSPPV
jgi:hypothetical protein